MGTVSAITEDRAVEVDGVHQYVADIRLLTDDVSGQSEESGASSDSDEDESVLRQELRRSQRVRRQPWRYDAMDFACAACDLAIKERYDYMARCSRLACALCHCQVWRRARVTAQFWANVRGLGPVRMSGRATCMMMI